MREHFGKNQFVSKKKKNENQELGFGYFNFQMLIRNPRAEFQMIDVSVNMGEKCNIFMHLYLATELILKSLSYNIYILNHSSIHVAWLSKK